MLFATLKKLHGQIFVGCFYVVGIGEIIFGRESGKGFEFAAKVGLVGVTAIISQGGKAQIRLMQLFLKEMLETHDLHERFGSDADSSVKSSLQLPCADL